MAYSNGASKEIKNAHSSKVAIASTFKSAALQASKEFLKKHGDGTGRREAEIDPKNPLRGLTFKIIHDSEDEMEEFVASSQRTVDQDDEDDDEEEEPHQGGIQSEDDDDLIDEETDLPIDESELMLPGGSSFPLLPLGEGPVQWSESSRIECGRTVFLMFASEMFQYRLTAAYLSHQTRQRQLKLIAEVEEEERVEKAKRAREEKEKKDKIEQEKRKKAARKEKAAAKTVKKPSEKNKDKTFKNPIEKRDPDLEPEPEPEPERKLELEPEIVEDKEIEIEINLEPIIEPIDDEITVPETVAVSIESVSSSTSTSTSEPVFIPATPQESIFSASHTFVIQSAQRPRDDDYDDFDPNELIEQLSKEMNRFEMSSVTSATKSVPLSDFDSGSGSGSGNVVGVGPPGFAPPPGFSPPCPKHLEPSLPENSFHYPRPPFSQYDQQLNYHPNTTNGGYNQNYSHQYNGSGIYQQGGFNQTGQIGQSGYNNHQHPPQQQPQQQQQQQYYPYVGYPSSNTVYNHSNPQSLYYNNTQPHPHPHPHPTPQNSNSQPPQQYQRNFDPFQEDPNTSPDSGHSRFQSFFSKSIFGPSTFFSQQQ